jgi:hypothetical protein
VTCTYWVLFDANILLDFFYMLARPGTIGLSPLYRATAEILGYGSEAIVATNPYLDVKKWGERRQSKTSILSLMVTWGSDMNNKYVRAFAALGTTLPRAPAAYLCGTAPANQLRPPRVATGGSEQTKEKIHKKGKNEDKAAKRPFLKWVDDNDKGNSKLAWEIRTSAVAGGASLMHEQGAGTTKPVCLGFTLEGHKCNFGKRASSFT